MNRVSEKSFPLARLTRLAEIERWHFWFIGRRKLIARLLDKYLRNREGLLLDLGCGTGLMVENLVRAGYRVVGLDRLPEGLTVARQLGGGAWPVQSEATRLPLRSGVFGGVLLLDVLEHVEEKELLHEVRRILAPGGVLVITVPAIPWLWSYRDEAAGHLRRYRRRQLARLLEAGGFQVKEMRFYQCILFPMVLLTRVLGKKNPGLRDFEERPLPAFNRALTWVNRLEVRLGEVIPWPWGSSLAVVGQKR